MSLVDLGKRLLDFAKRGETEEVRALMSNGAPFTTDWLGTSPLHMAAQYGHVNTAEVLLRAGISRDARTKVDRTPLHIAAQEGHTAIVEMLIKHGAEVDAKDMLQMTPLHWAVERGHIPVINCLLTYNADTHACSKFNKTPIDIAEENNRVDIMQILREHAAFRKKNPKGIGPKKVLMKVIPKGPRLILPKPQALMPINIIKKDSFSNVKDLVNRTVVTQTTNNNNMPRNVNVTTSSAKIIKTTHPVVFHPNLTEVKNLTPDVHKNTKLSSGEYGEGDTSDQSCTNVLATLAALAEATAPNATISTQEAVQWLELHGITMLPSDNSTIVATALEGGQSVSLTEAGKLALTWVKEHKDLNNGSSSEDSSFSEKPLSKAAVPTNQQVITIVADKSQIPSIISTQKSPIVVLSGQSVNSERNAEAPPVKKVKTQEGMKLQSNGKINTAADGDDERLLLQKELEMMKKKAEEYKAQLLKKEHEAEEYRKQLEKLKNNTDEM